MALPALQRQYNPEEGQHLHWPQLEWLKSSGTLSGEEYTHVRRCLRTLKDGGWAARWRLGEGNVLLEQSVDKQRYNRALVTPAHFDTAIKHVLKEQYVH